MHAFFNIAGVRFGANGGGGYNSGGSSPASYHSGSSKSEGSISSADEFSQELREFLRNSYSPFRSCVPAEFGYQHTHPVPESTVYVLEDIRRHQQLMLTFLPAFSPPATAAARADALFRWLAGFGVGWVLDMSGGDGMSFPQRREVGRRVREWTQALSTMERVFRLRHRFTDAQEVSMRELATASSGAMLNMADAVATLRSSPWKLLAALDVYVPVSEAFPALAMKFSWGPSHSVSVTAEAKLAALVDAARSCGQDLKTFIRSDHPWRMPKVGEVHPCVGYWMDYFCCMLRSRIYLHVVLGNDDGDGDGQGGLSLVPELISCLESLVEEKSATVAFPGLRHLFMLNNTFAIVRRAVRSDIKMFLPPEWVSVHEERMEGYIKGYLEASWAPVLSRLDGSGTKLITSIFRRRNRLRSFYSALENACSAQRYWKVPNPVLRGILRKTVSENVVPAYCRYLKDHPEIEVANEHTAEALEQQLSDLFEG